MNLPSSWPRMGFTAKAGWLVQAHVCRDYAEACRWLRLKHRKTPKPVARPTVYWWQK